MIFIILIFSAFLTAFYMGRQILLVFFGKARSQAAENARENPPIITLPLVVLAILSVFGGALNLPGLHTLGKWLEESLAQTSSAEFILWVALLSLVVALAGLFIAWMVYSQRRMPFKDADPLAKSLGGLFTALQHKWWVDELYQAVILRPYRKVSEFLANPVDMGFIDGIANGLGTASRAVGQQVQLEKRLCPVLRPDHHHRRGGIMAYLLLR